MKNVKLLLILLLACITYSASAQDDDWQIGGGSTTKKPYSGSTYSSSSYSYTGNTVTLWNGGYEDAPYGIVMGYVNKQWTSEYSSGTRKENFFGSANRRFHGLQVGLQGNPSFKWGLGLHTGIYYEAYFAEGDDVKEQGWDRYIEHDLYIPLHASYRLPFNRNCAFTLFGGMGFQWAIAGEYREYGHSGYDYYGNYNYYGPRQYQGYGNGWPKHVNWQLEAGVNLRLSPVVLSFTYSYGLTNHRLQSNELGNAIKSRQDKIAASIGFCF